MFVVSRGWVTAGVMQAIDAHGKQPLPECTSGEKEKERKKKTTPFGVKLLRSQVLHRANLWWVLIVGADCTAVYHYPRAVSVTNMHTCSRGSP